MILAGLYDVKSVAVYDADTLLAAATSAESQLKARTRGLIWTEMRRKARLIEEPVATSIVTRLFDFAEDKLKQAPGSARAQREQRYLNRITETWPQVEKMDTDDLLRLVRRLGTTDLPRILKELQLGMKAEPGMPRLAIVASGDPVRVQTYRPVQHRQSPEPEKE